MSLGPQQEFFAKQRQIEKDYSEIVPAGRAKGKNANVTALETAYYACNALWRQIFALGRTKTAH